MLRSRIALAMTLSGLATTAACRSQPATSSTTVTSAEVDRISVGAEPAGNGEPAAYAGANTAGPTVQIRPVFIAEIAVPEVVVLPVGVDAATPQPRKDGSVDAEPPTATTTSQVETSFPTSSPATVRTTVPASFPETTFGLPASTVRARGHAFPETTFGPPKPATKGFPETTFGSGS